MKEKSPTVRLALAGILGFTGAQRFYMGKWKTGILWLVTFGLLGIGWLADLIVALVRFAKYDKAHEKDSASIFSTLTRRFLPSISAGIGLVVSLVIVIGIWFVSVPIALRGDSAPAETEPESAEATPAEVKPADPEAPEKKAQTFQAGQVTQAAADPEAAPGEVKPAEPEENADAEQPAPEAPETDTPVVVPEPEPEPEITGNGVDPVAWPGLAALNLDNSVMLSLYYDYKTAMLPENYPANYEDYDVYDRKMAEDAAEKYGITPEEANTVYNYVLMNFAKVKNNGKPVNTEFKAKFGELLSVSGMDGTVVVKTKISPSYSNEGTINQNFYTVCDMIRNQDLYLYDTVSYWAVADMTNGNEEKVISFTVPSDLIQTIKENGTQFPDKYLGQYLTDLWVHPSLEG